MLSPEQIELQAYVGDCSYVAIRNLFRLRGLDPPPLEALRSGFELLAQGPSRADGEGPTPLDLLHLVSAYSSFLAALIFIPGACWANPQKLLTKFLDQGCRLLLIFTWKAESELVRHVSVVEGYDERGYVLVDSDGLPEGTIFELEPNFSETEMAAALDRRRKHPHGSRVVLPYCGVATADHPLGIMPHVIVTWPDAI